MANFWLIIFYIFSICNIFLVLKLFRVTSHQDFRDEIGDNTTEIGYFEDSLGQERHDEEHNAPVVAPDEPHIAYEPVVRTEVF